MMPEETVLASAKTVLGSAEIVLASAETVLVSAEVVLASAETVLASAEAEGMIPLLPRAMARGGTLLTTHSSSGKTLINMYS